MAKLLHMTLGMLATCFPEASIGTSCRTHFTEHVQQQELVTIPAQTRYHLCNHVLDHDNLPPRKFTERCQVPGGHAEGLTMNCYGAALLLDSC